MDEIVLHLAEKEKVKERKGERDWRWEMGRDSEWNEWMEFHGLPVIDG